MMPDDHWIYLNNPDNTCRYALGERGERMIACIGINPSTAQPGKLDSTMRSVQRIANFNGYDGWVMYNLYPLRATNPSDLPLEADRNLHRTNLDAVCASIQELNIDTVWAAYGDLVDFRPYLKPNLAELYHQLKPLQLRWKMVQTLTKKGHPRHPLYKPTKSTFLDIDMEKYAQSQLTDLPSNI